MQTLPITAIQPNPDQPRKVFNPEHIRGLADSIRAEGLHQAILVRPRDGAYEIVYGECRWRAHCLLTEQGVEGFSTIQADVKTLSDRERDLTAIVENMQRADISPLEEARAFRRLVDQGMTAEELATATGATRYKIEWRLRLLSLTPEILQLFEGGQIDLQQATEIARLPDAAEQHRILRLINRGQIVGWRTLHNSISAILESKTVVDLFGDDAPKASDEEVAILNLMERKIETVVGMVAAGWREGQCVVAAKVSRDRSAVMAEKIRAIRQSLTRMESDLRNVTAQASIVLGEAA